MNATAMSLEQHGLALETAKPAGQMLLIIDRIRYDNLREPTRKTPVIISVPKRAIQARRRNLEGVGVIDRVFDVEEGAHIAADPLAVLDADPCVGLACRPRRPVGHRPIKIDPHDPPLRFAPILYVGDFQVIGPRDALGDISYPVFH